MSVLAVVVAAALLAVPGASAAAWSTPAPLDSVVMSDSWVAISRTGDATAVWRQPDGGSSGGHLARASSRPAGGTWSPPVTLGPGGRYAPSVAMDDDGNAIAVWERSKSGTEPARVLAARRTAGGSWSAEPEILATASGEASFYAPVVVVDDAGDATAVWTQLVPSGGTPSVWAATRPVGGAWSSPKELDTNSACIFPAVDGAGAVTVLWRRVGGPGAPWEVRSAVRPRGGAWSPPATVHSTDRRIGYCPELAVNEAGQAIAAWRTVENDPGEPTFTRLRVARRSAGGTWGMPAVLEDEGVSASLAIDREGNATVIWQSAATEPRRVRAAQQAAGGAWSAAVTLDADGHIGRYDTNGYVRQLGVDAAGNVTAVWSHSRSSIRSAVLSPGGSWSEPVELDTGGAEIPALAVNTFGDAAAVWSHAPGAGFTYDAIYAATRPGAAGPRVTLSGSATPASAPVGAPVRVSFAAANAGTETAADVHLLVAVPSGLRDATATVSQGTCASTAGGFDCAVGSIAPGGSRQLSLDAVVDRSGASTVTAEARSSGRTSPDATARVTVTGTSAEPPADPPADPPIAPPAPPPFAPAPLAPVLPPPPTASEVLLSCTGSDLAILDVRMAGARARIAGQAKRVLAGRTVELFVVQQRRPSQRKPAGSATIGPDGSFAASVKPPPRAKRATAAYVARVGTTVSRAVELQRRMVLTSVVAQGARVLLRGRVSGPLPRTPQPVIVTLQTDCGARKRVGRVRAGRDGRFSLRVALAQPPARAAIYRAETRVPARPGRAATERTFTLPAAVAVP